MKDKIKYQIRLDKTSHNGIDLKFYVDSAKPNGDLLQKYEAT